MNIIEQRVLRGPNLHSSAPCLLTVIDLEQLQGVSTNALPDFNSDLLALMPTLRQHYSPPGRPGGFVKRLEVGTFMARVVEHVTLELQGLAGTPVGFGRSCEVTGQSGRYRVVCGYQHEQVAQEAFSLAMLIAETLARGAPFDLDEPLATLRRHAERCAIGISTAAIIDAAARRGIPTLRLTEEADLFQLGWGSGQQRLRATVTGKTSQVAVGIAADRQLTKTLLSRAGVPVSEVPGGVYRVLVAGGRVAAAARRIPSAGTEEALADKASLPKCGAEDVTDLLPSSTREICIRAAAVIGLDIAGIDIVCEDIAVPLDDQGGGITEVHAAPDISMHQHPSLGQPRDAGDAIVEVLFDTGNGRIPVVAVTGTNGKTTTALLLAHAARTAGLGAGVTTTEGVFINGVCVDKGDCSGYWSARTVLSSPQVDYAVLETARGGILKRGLAFDQCDVAVVLNVSADHLGLDGVDTLEELAEVKAVVARTATRAVVLNAEDPYCVAMANQVDDGVEALYFSLDAEHPVLLNHLAQRGRAVYVQDGVLILADGTRRHALIAVAAMPISVRGHSAYNIANALAAAAALVATGFTHEQIVDGLQSFVSDHRSNPLRTNIYRIGDATLVIDYAHNPAAYRALGKMARSMTGHKVIGVVTAPGDRRDADLMDVGRACAADFDEVIVYQSNPRGRPEGETGSLIVAGVRQQNPVRNVQQIDDVRGALAAALMQCGPGDVLVYSCPSTPHALVEALRETYPEHAAAIDSDHIP